MAPYISDRRCGMPLLMQEQVDAKAVQLGQEAAEILQRMTVSIDRPTGPSPTLNRCRARPCASRRSRDADPGPLSPRCPHPDTRDDLVPDAFRRSPKLATGSSSPRKIGAECPKPISGQLYDQNLLPPPKFFLQKRAPQKATPFRGGNHFWTGFWERGHE